MDFWNKIKDELDYQGLSQKEFAAKLNINVQTLRNSISLNRLPDLESAYKMAKLLNQPLEYFMDGEVFTPNNYHLPIREIKLLEKYRSLPDQEKNAIDKMLESLAKDKTGQIDWSKTVNIEFNTDNSAPEDINEVLKLLSTLTASEREPIIEIIKGQVVYWKGKR